MLLIQWYQAVTCAFFSQNLSNLYIKNTQGNSYYPTYYFDSNRINWMNEPELKDKITYTTGIVVGTGDREPSIYDYTLSGEVITGLTATIAHSANVDETGITRTMMLTIANNNSADVTIREIGLLGHYQTQSSGTGTYQAILVDRTVLDVPVTIPAGGFGQVEYTITFNYPTA